MEDKWLVDLGGFIENYSSIHEMRSALIFKYHEEGFFKLMADRFMSREVMLFILFALISSMLLSNVVSGPNLSASIIFLY